MSSEIWIVMRSKNDIAVIERTLKAVRSQTISARILNIDSGSRDGTRDICSQYCDRIIDIKPEEYIPGAILNRGMRHTAGDVVVFLNSDAVPVDEHWLENLLKPFQDPEVAAVFGRQVARKNAQKLVHFDTERAYGDGQEHARWQHFFSMANSAVRRSEWLARPFDEQLRYSEDVDWSWRLKQCKRKVVYVADAIAEHSHNYSLREHFKRQYGEGVADSRIYKIRRQHIGFYRHFLAPTLAAWIRDCNLAIGSADLALLFHSFVLRPTQLFGRFNGLKVGAFYE